MLETWCRDHSSFGSAGGVTENDGEGFGVTKGLGEVPFLRSKHE